MISNDCALTEGDNILSKEKILNLKDSVKIQRIVLIDLDNWNNPFIEILTEIMNFKKSDLPEM